MTCFLPFMICFLLVLNCLLDLRSPCSQFSKASLAMGSICARLKVGIDGSKHSVRLNHKHDCLGVDRHLSIPRERR